MPSVRIRLGAKPLKHCERTWVIGIMKGGAEDLPCSGEVHDVELVVEDEENVEALVLVHHRRSLMRTRTHLADCWLNGVEGVW